MISPVRFKNGQLPVCCPCLFFSLSPLFDPWVLVEGVLYILFFAQGDSVMALFGTMLVIEEEKRLLYIGSKVVEGYRE